MGARASVLRLDGLDEPARKLEVVGPCDPWKIGGQEPRRSRLGARTPDVASELAEPLVRRRFALVPDDQRSPARRFAALRTWMMESRSSRFSAL